MRMLPVAFLLLLWTIVAGNPSAGAVELRTADGRVLQLGDQTGQVESVTVAGQRLPLLKRATPLSVAEFDVGTVRNLVPNPGLEDDAQPVDWKRDAQASGLSRAQNHTPGGKSCGRVATPPNASAAAPATAPRVFSSPLPAKPNTTYRFSAWGFVEPGSSGGTVFALELDAEGKVILDAHRNVQHGIGFTSATAGQWASREIRFTTKPNCARLQVYANIWKGHGTFCFDDVELVDVDACWRELPLPPTPLVRMADGRWRQIARLTAAGLECQLTYRSCGDRLQVQGTVHDVRRPPRARAVRLRWALPLDTSGWTWHDDGRSARAMTPDQAAYENSMPLCCGRMSRYPFSSITRAKLGVGLAVPLDAPRLVNLLCEPQRGYLASVDLGLSPLTVTVGPGCGDFTLLVYAHDGRWGLRAAAKRYYQMYPECFKKRVQREGLWFYVVPVESIPHPEDFGLAFYEGFPRRPAQRTYALEHGIYVFPYTEPWGARQVFRDAKESHDLPPLEERLAILRAWAEGEGNIKMLGGPRREVARALLNSIPYDRQGVPCGWKVDKYEHWAQWWMTNTNPDLPRPNRATTCMQYEIEPVLAQSDGIYLDSVTSWLGNYLDFRAEHVAAARIPPVFDPQSGRPAVFGAFTTAEFIDWLAGQLHARGKLIHMNVFPEAYRFCAAWGDVLGSEVGWSGRRRPLADAETDACSLLRRTYAYQKPTANLLQEGDYRQPTPELSQADVEQYIQHQLFYGFYPGIATIGGEERPGYAGWKRYFGTPAQYERDRPLFRRYLPILRRLCAAGWEPVTGARTSSDTVLIERFGYWDRGNLHFTLRNVGNQPAQFTVTLDPSDLGATASALQQATYRELLAARAVPAQRDGAGQTVTLRLALGAKQTGVVCVTAAGGGPKPTNSGPISP